MEKLLEMANRESDAAEVYSADIQADSVSFEDARLKDIESRMQSGISLRILKDGVQGFAYTRNLRSREELIRNALASLRGGVEGTFEFPFTTGLPSLDTCDPSIGNFRNETMVEECARVCDLFLRKTTAQVNAAASRSVSSIRIINSAGTDLSLRSSAYSFQAGLLYPYTSASVHRTFRAKTFEQVPQEYLDFLEGMYTNSVREIIPPGRPLKVIFLPETVYVLMWRLQTATNAQSIHQNISPLAHRMDDKIFSDLVSVYNDPLNEVLPGARAFDDEGIPCSRFPVIEQGVLKHFYYDLYFARKMKTRPTGHGFKSSVSGKPAPSLRHLTMTPGGSSFADMVRSVDHGIIIAGALGAHSGNIPHGDFSIGISPAPYIEHGEITGNVKDAMVAGNIFETMQHIVAVENRLHPSPGGNFPALLLENVHVTLKQ
ncbi:MAG: TldD/PmbA family protein [Nitrospirota bacterium]